MLLVSLQEELVLISDLFKGLIIIGKWFLTFDHVSLFLFGEPDYIDLYKDDIN